ncbi:MAG: 30S ribosomal protein S17 [Gammaproteobacteria bacterium]|nr:30S ribosomal protein S17 [Gammaproteobacteria bacterium]
MSTPSNKTAATGTSRRIAGIVVSDKMQGTIIVEQTRLVKHPRYGKYVKRKTRVYADNPGDKARMHDSVVVESCRPLSKLKSWRLVSRKAAVGAEPIPGDLDGAAIAATPPTPAPAPATPTSTSSAPAPTPAGTDD